MSYAILVTCPKDIENLLEDELGKFGATDCKQTVGGVFAKASLKTIYKLCLWSRLANRVLLKLASEPVKSSKDCYQVCNDLPWPDIFASGRSLSIKFRGKLPSIKNEMYGGLLLKDAIVDKFRDKTETRPNIDSSNANCKIDARLQHGKLNIYFDLSGHSLHQRGYREQAGAAPLKENLAAAMLYRANWPKLLKEGYALVDPFCGSGTLLIEAAFMALNKAPGLDCEEFGFMFWKDHQAEVWQAIKADANKAYQANLKKPKPIIMGYDIDSRVIDVAKNNISMADCSAIIGVQQRSISQFALGDEFKNEKGLLITNPPYGERLNDSPNLMPLYQQLGEGLNKYCQGWKAAVLTSDKFLAKGIGLRSQKQYSFLNGSLACKLYLIDLETDNKLATSTKTVPAAAEMIFNRIKKNAKNLKSWRKNNDIHCYRVYDADIPEYAFAIDVYEDHVHVQEYMAPKEIPPEKTEKRLMEALQAIPFALDVPAKQIVLKQRQRQKGKAQYQKQAQTKQEFTVKEGAAKFVVNCRDYLDTGLFLDHRLIRMKFFELSKNKTFLNLFCYTATASVHAALGGASRTVSVDMSRTYLDWAKHNYLKNDLNLRTNELIQANCLSWIKNCKDKFDLIFLDPPSFSNSKRMDDVLDIQRDHAKIIDDTMALLEPSGELYFSNNYRKFKLDASVSEKYQVMDITAKTIDKDFARNPNIHKCYIIKFNH